VSHAWDDEDRADGENDSGEESTESDLEEDAPIEADELEGFDDIDDDEDEQ
jgi:hypothetical protein